MFKCANGKIVDFLLPLRKIIVIGYKLMIILVSCVCRNLGSHLVIRIHTYINLCIILIICIVIFVDHELC